MSFNPLKETAGPAPAAELSAVAPPHSTEVERAVISALLTSPDALRVALAMLKTSEAFYQPLHRHVFEAATYLHNAGMAVDYLSVSERMRETHRLPATGGANAVAALAGGSLTLDVETHSLKLLEYYTLRQVLSAAQQMVRDVQDRSQAPLEILAKSQQAISTCVDALSIKKSQTLHSLYPIAFEHIKKAMETKSGITGVEAGLLEMDTVTGGWQPGNLIIIAARPGAGKTTLALNMARNASVRFEKPGAFFSLEMGEIELTLKLISAETLCTTNELTKGKLPEGKTLDGLMQEAHQLKTTRLLVDDSSTLTLGQFRAKAARLKAENDIQWIIIDYLQLMSNPGAKGGNREQEIASISRGLKQTAKELQIPVIALAQLSRASESRADKRPMLSDLRESGAIEQDADVVLFPFRPEYYGITEDELGNSTVGTAELIFAKHRNGPTATVNVLCDMATSRFYSPEPDWSSFADVVPDNKLLPASTFDQEPPAPRGSLGSQRDDTPPPF